MSHNQIGNDEVNRAVEKLSKVSKVEISTDDVIKIYISLMQNSVYQAMLNSFLARKGVISDDEYNELDKKNSEYQKSMDDFLINVSEKLELKASAENNDER